MSTFETVTESDGTKLWYKDGKLHRDGDLPAVVKKTRKEWYQDGLLHREGSPAIEFADGTKAWYRHGKEHRDGGPAVEYSNGKRQWLRNGKLHREDGPAVEYASARPEEWWIDDVKLRPEQVSSLKAAFTLKAVTAPFKGTLAPVIAPEKAAFRNQKRPRLNAASLTR